MVCFSDSMEETAFVKCEPAWPSDIKEEPSNFEETIIMSSDNRVKIKKDPNDVVSDRYPEGVDIKLVKEHFSDEEQTAILSSDNQVKIKEDPNAVVSDQISEEVDIKLVKEHFSDEDEVGEVHNEESQSSAGSSLGFTS
ncbi:uncharacterized protein [Anabrus simplex]|uniref:uncharacterized protein isoform X5 n=1 Tax=Anabrus simplex TaxID=316456 RepID=UPI0035A2CCEE